VANLELARRCVSAWPPVADQLAAAFWPGPLTLVLPRSQEIPPLVTAGGATVGVRWPRHPLIQAVIRACGFPLAAPSANRSNGISPTTAEHVRKDLGSAIALIIDGGPCDVGIESSVLDLASATPRLLRPGLISAESLQTVLAGCQVAIGGPSSLIARSPGQMPRHYSPKARLVLLQWRDESDLAAQVTALGSPRDKIHIITRRPIQNEAQYARIAYIPPDAKAWSRKLYAELHRSDDAGAELIIVETPPPEEPWRAIADRLHRAAHATPDTMFGAIKQTASKTMRTMTDGS
jgi:L-threonylcarbamoyladenylate synthase